MKEKGNLKFVLIKKRKLEKKQKNMEDENVKLERIIENCIMDKKCIKNDTLENDENKSKTSVFTGNESIFYKYSGEQIKKTEEYDDSINSFSEENSCFLYYLASLNNEKNKYSKTSKRPLLMNSPLPDSYCLKQAVNERINKIKLIPENIAIDINDLSSDYLENRSDDYRNWFLMYAFNISTNKKNLSMRIQIGWLNFKYSIKLIKYSKFLI